MSRLTSFLLALLAMLAGVTSAPAADLVAVRIDEPGICRHQRVLNRIVDRFAYQVRHVPHLPNVAILDFYQVTEVRYLPRREEWPIERRYCRATVALSDGESRTVRYLIERPMGFAGIGSNVEFCVMGFDRWYVYGGRCRVLY